jgi:hypothetical protein
MKLTKETIDAWKGAASAGDYDPADHADKLRVLHDALGEQIEASKDHLAAIEKAKAAYQEAIDAHKELIAAHKGE